MPSAYESDGAVVWCIQNNNNAVTVPLPAIRPVGSVLLFVAWCRLITAAAPAPAGYTLLGTWTSATASGGRMWLYAKEVVGDETAPSVIPAGATGTTGDVWGADIFCYSGIDLSGGIANILDGTPTVTDTSGTTTNTYPALTIAQADSMIIRFLSRFRDAVETFTPTADWNEREDAASTNRTGGQFHWQDKIATSAGVQPAVTVVPSVTSSGRYLAVSAALKASPIQTLYGATSLAVSFGSNINGTAVHVHYGSLSLPITFGSAIDGKVTKTYFGSLSLPMSFGASVRGSRKAFGQLSLPITFSKDIRGIRKTFGQIIAPFVFGKDVKGQKKTFGQVSLPIIFGKEVVGRKVVFGKIDRPFVFGSVIQGRRLTFGRLSFPMYFAITVKSGRIETHGQLSLPIIADIFVTGKRTHGAIILNEAEALYLGTDPVNAVYVGTQQVWPTWSPLKIPGLATWLDANDYVSNFWPNKGSGPAITIAGSPPMTIGPLKNGLPVVRFKTSEARIRSAWPYPFYDFTLIYVVRWVGPGVGRAFSVQYPPSNLLVGMHTSQPDTAYDNGTWLTKGTSWANWGAGPSPWRMYGADSQSGQGMGFYVDGVPIGGRSGDSAGLTGGWGISGYETTGPGETVDIEMPEFLLFNRKLPDAERQLLEAYLREKWGV